MANKIVSIDCFQSYDNQVRVKISRQNTVRHYHLPKEHPLLIKMQQLVARSVARDTAQITPWSIGIVGWTAYPVFYVPGHRP